MYGQEVPEVPKQIVGKDACENVGAYRGMASITKYIDRTINTLVIMRFVSLQPSSKYVLGCPLTILITSPLRLVRQVVKTTIILTEYLEGNRRCPVSLSRP